MRYERQFNPLSVRGIGRDSLGAAPLGDRRDGGVYVYSETIILAINVALAIGRPLLVHGPSGSGKSSLARSIACEMSWRYYEHVVSSRTQARDLLWQFDSIKRLSDAHVKQLRPDAAYVNPGVLWWAFDRESARARGVAMDNSIGIPTAIDPCKDSTHERAVVLIDEIDKADPDVPNDLLVPLGSFEFSVPEIDDPVKAVHPPLVVITSNEERELPKAFVRRCVPLRIEQPDAGQLIKVAKAHFGDGHVRLYRSIARSALKKSEWDETQGRSTNAAEFLDAVRACLALGT
jgi:MoxR-like ATPase